jgi:hypothetical protein
MGRRAVNADTRRLIVDLKRRGYTVDLAMSGHYHVRFGGRLVASVAATPSDWRSRRNVLAQIRRFERLGTAK